jgi:hypothetical protein
LSRGAAQAILLNLTRAAEDVTGACSSPRQQGRRTGVNVARSASVNAARSASVNAARSASKGLQKGDDVQPLLALRAVNPRNHKKNRRTLSAFRTANA